MYDVADVGYSKKDINVTPQAGGKRAFLVMTTKKILIVEDDQPLARALELKLTNEGFQIKVASDGEEGLKVLGGEVFDLVLLDLILPKMDGFTVLTQMRARHMTVPVIVLSNLSQEADTKKAESLGARQFFVKADTPIAKIVEYIKQNL